jgi:hypothetical protein
MLNEIAWYRIIVKGLSKIYHPLWDLESNVWPGDLFAIVTLGVSFCKADVRKNRLELS